MPVRFAVVPQWQGSGSSRAMRLVDGAEAIRGDLPTASTIAVDVPMESGDAEGTGIARFSSLRLVRQRYAQALAGVGDPVVTVGGDCGVEYPAVARAAAERRVALVWLDAHPDANSPDSSPSHAFHGMVARALVDDGVIDASRLVLAGTRNLDPAEESWISERGVRMLDVAETRDADAVAAAVAATGADAVYVHIDLDVLDPSAIEHVTFPEPFGLRVDELVAAIGAARRDLPLGGAGLTEFAPPSAAAAGDDMGAVLRIVAALTRGA